MTNSTTSPAATRAVPRRMVASRAPGRGVSRGPAGVIALRSPEEIRRMRAAGVVVRRALDAARDACVVGATTADVDAAASMVIASAGAEALFRGYPSSDGALPFPAATCVSVNEEIVHGIPGQRRLAKGDLVSIDCGVRLDGWCGDAAITLAIGGLDPVADADRMSLLTSAESMLAAAIAMIRPGVRWSVVARAMQSIALEAGHGCVVEYVGHGIGRTLHESPQVPNCLSAGFLARGDFTLRPGMVLAIEPMLTLRPGSMQSQFTPPGHGDCFPVGVATKRLSDGWTVVAADGSPAAHVEHTVAVTRRGCVVLTAAAEDAVLDSMDSPLAA